MKYTKRNTIYDILQTDTHIILHEYNENDKYIDMKQIIVKYLNSKNDKSLESIKNNIEFEDLPCNKFYE